MLRRQRVFDWGGWSKDSETDFRSGGVDKYLGGGGTAACFGRGLVATPGKAKEKV